MSTKVGKVSHQDKPLEFPAKLEHLYEMLTYIKESATLIGFSNTLISKIELAGEEALVNIISHGYPNQPGTISIYCKKEELGTLLIVIEDDGIAFNPLKALKRFNPEDETREGKICENSALGGYGIYFIINMMDHVDYDYVDGRNILSLRKYLG
ncbi:MAG: ATP-binding protein [Chlamydiota bacterium]